MESKSKFWLSKVIAVSSIVYCLYFFVLHAKLLYRDYFQPDILSSFYFRQHWISSWAYFIILLVAAIMLLINSKKTGYIKLYQFVFLGLIIELILNYTIWQQYDVSLMDLAIYLLGLIYFSSKKMLSLLKREGVNLVRHYLVLVIINVLLVVIPQIIQCLFMDIIDVSSMS